MFDRALTAVGTPGDVVPCRYCTPGRETVPAGDKANPVWLAHLYLCRGPSTYAIGSPQIAAITGIPERTVRDRLRRYGIAACTRGGWNREDRRTVPAEILDDLYTRLGLTADEVGRKLGTTRNTVLRSAHALGVPVRAISGETTRQPGGCHQAGGA